jgi:hypothetical protein
MPEPTNPAVPLEQPADEAADAAPADGPTTTCAVCGKERPADWRCGCGGGDAPGPIVPKGWDPALTRGTGPRLPLVGKQGGRAR